MNAVRPWTAGLAAAAAMAAGGCGDAGEDAPQKPARADAERPAREGATGAPRVERVPCPDGLAGCRSARGEIVYVERVDSDGDGDAHFVLLSEAGVTGPGITVIDVSADLRPRPLPEPGDALAAAGPVYEGSYGQRQIEAVAVRVAGAG